MEKDYLAIVAVAENLREGRAKIEDPWENSPFAWIKTLPSRTIGAIGEQIIEDWAKSEGFRVERTGDSEADRKINGIRVEIKLSTLWTENQIFKFQQIRNQDYEYCICIGLFPRDVSAWIIPKSELMAPREGLTHQHGGASGTDTFWLSFSAASPPEWLTKFGGTLDDVKSLLLEATSRR